MLMSYAIDLNPRQSARTLEQALRQQAQVILEPRVWGDSFHLLGRLEPAGNAVDLDLVPVLKLSVLGRCEAGLVPTGPVEPIQPISLEELHGLTGTYVDAVMPLGEQRYMFSTDVMRLVPAANAGEPPQMHVTRPAVLQVAQRRRFRRIQLSHSAQVDLTWSREGQPQMGGVGWLFNISGNGMACRTEGRISETLWIGDEIEAEFTLAPGDTERFHLQGVVCSKTPTGSLGKVILGIQFLADEGHPASAQTARLLRQRLIERATQLADTQKGVDW